jgi:hypothetical protein
MRFRKLRIAWSVFWGLVFVLLIVLWVRSYWQFDLVLVRLSASNDVRIVSYRGQVASCISRPSGGRVAGEFRISPNAYMNSKAPWWISGTINSELGGSLQRNFTPNPVRMNFGEMDGRIVVVPLWIALASSGSLATLPWIHWSNRFSLRTLLIATTLIAVVLGLAVCAARNGVWSN